MRIFLFLCFCSSSLFLFGCDAAPAKKPVAKKTAVKKKAKEEDDDRPKPKPRNTIADRVSNLNHEQSIRYSSIGSDFDVKENLFVESSDALSDLANEFFGKEGALKEIADQAIEGDAQASGPKRYEELLEQRRERLRGLRKTLDDFKSAIPDTLTVMNLYRTSRELLDGAERLIDAHFAPLKDSLYDDKFTAEQKKTNVERARLACFQEADKWSQARQAAKEAYVQEGVNQKNEIVLKMVLKPSFQPPMTTIPPPAAKQ